MTTEELDKALQDHATQAKNLIEQLRERLGELDDERREIRTKLAKLEGREEKQQKRGVGGGRGRRSSIGKAIVELLREAGDDGMNSGEIFDALIEEGVRVDRSLVLTHLSRMRKRNTLKTEGDTGYRQYILTTNGQA
jgi:hypothetical protein